LSGSTLKVIAVITPLELDPLAVTFDRRPNSSRLTTVPDCGRACSWHGLMAITVS
jgi:hypothetical protein